jgi:hypothetical protein
MDSSLVLVSLMKCHGRNGMTAVIFFASVSEKYGLKRFC